MTNKQYLNEITYLRPVIVFLIVVNHSFAVYSGVWNSPWGDCAPNSVKLFRFAIPFVVYYMLFQIRAGLYTIGFFNLFMGNMITTFIYNDNTPIIDLIGINF